MEQQVVELLREVNIAQIFILLLAIWAFYRRLDSKIGKLETRIEKLSDKVEDIDRRLCRIEGGIERGRFIYRRKRRSEFYFPQPAE